MDTTDLQTLATVMVAIAMVGIGFWALNPRRKKDFDEAANLPFADSGDARSRDKEEKK
jgi:cytochrome c oxidase cbb3-type subunit 4